jgi:hypothetical protein
MGLARPVKASQGRVLGPAAPFLRVDGAADDGGIPSHGIGLLTMMPVRL